MMGNKSDLINNFLMKNSSKNSFIQGMLGYLAVNVFFASTPNQGRVINWFTTSPLVQQLPGRVPQIIRNLVSLYTLAQIETFTQVGSTLYRLPLCNTWK